MVKMCPICNHTGELAWRDGKYYCAMCGSEVDATLPQQPQYTAPAQPQTVSAVCPICGNRENNTFDGQQYRCAMCASRFNPQATQTQVYRAQTGYSSVNSGRIEELKKQKDKNLILGLIFVCIFWPVSIYFFYKLYTTNQELKALTGK